MDAGRLGKRFVVVIFLHIIHFVAGTFQRVTQERSDFIYLLPVGPHGIDIGILKKVEAAAEDIGFDVSPNIAGHFVELLQFFGRNAVDVLMEIASCLPLSNWMPSIPKSK